MSLLRIFGKSTRRPRQLLFTGAMATACVASMATMAFADEGWHLCHCQHQVTENTTIMDEKWCEDGAKCSCFVSPDGLQVTAVCVPQG